MTTEQRKFRSKTKKYHNDQKRNIVNDLDKLVYITRHNIVQITTTFNIKAVAALTAACRKNYGAWFC